MLGERCQVELKLDEKGRIALPARLRKRLRDAGINKLVLTFYDGGIRGFLPADFDRLVESPLRELDAFDPLAQDLHHTVLAGAEDCPVDRQGRLRLPPLLRGEAGLERDLVLHSILDWIEIWDRDRWRERLVAARAARAAALAARRGLPAQPPVGRAPGHSTPPHSTLPHSTLPHSTPRPDAPGRDRGPGPFVPRLVPRLPGQEPQGS